MDIDKFMEYEKRILDYQSMIMEQMMEIEAEQGIDIHFIEIYESLLESRCKYYYNAFRVYCERYKNSFWFIKPFLRRSVNRVAWEHNQAIARLIEVRTYKLLLNKQ